MALDRRRFLRSAALGGAASFVLPGAAIARNTSAACANRPSDATASGVEPQWTIPRSTLPADPNGCPVEHIGVLMMENRSYDTYFGWLENGRGFLNLGLDVEYTDPDDPSVTARPEHWAPFYRRCGHPDPGHNWNAGRREYRDGFLAGGNDEYALAYYLAEDIPAYARLARQFTVFDRYFCSVLGGTYPNRHYQHGGFAGTEKTNVFPHEADYPAGYEWDTIWDRLDDAGLTGAYYFVDLPFIAMYGPRHFGKMRPITQFFADAAAGTLPNVFFVDPAFLGNHRTDDHPGGADMNTGQAFVNNIAHAMLTSPQWEKSTLFVNYDEWGGFFDHVVPPKVADDQASDDLDEDWGQLGFRVPAIAISPYSRKGYVHHDGPYEHTSILKFISWRFGLEPLSLRHAEANNIGEAFDWSQPARTNIKLAQMETPTAFFSSGCETPEELEVPDDFAAFAQSSFLRSHGITIAPPAWPSVFGFGATGAPLATPSLALP